MTAEFQTQSVSSIFVCLQVDVKLFIQTHRFQSDFIRRRAGALTCGGVESAATLCKLRQRDAHLARETLGLASSSSSPSPPEFARCFLARTPELRRRKIIHRDMFVMTLLFVVSIFYFFFFFFCVASRSEAVKRADAAGRHLMEVELNLKLYSQGRS